MINVWGKFLDVFGALGYNNPEIECLYSSEKALDLKDLSSTQLISDLERLTDKFIAIEELSDSIDIVAGSKINDTENGYNPTTGKDKINDIEKGYTTVEDRIYSVIAINENNDMYELDGPRIYFSEIKQNNIAAIAICFKEDSEDIKHYFADMDFVYLKNAMKKSPIEMILVRNYASLQKALIENLKIEKSDLIMLNELLDEAKIDLITDE